MADRVVSPLSFRTPVLDNFCRACRRRWWTSQNRSFIDIALPGASARWRGWVVPCQLSAGGNGPVGTTTGRGRAATTADVDGEAPSRRRPGLTPAPGGEDGALPSWAEWEQVIEEASTPRVWRRGACRYGF
jgi:hypothetical protein